jgi:hypothetical protein
MRREHATTAPTTRSRSGRTDTRASRSPSRTAICCRPRTPTATRSRPRSATACSSSPTSGPQSTSRSPAQEEGGLTMSSGLFSQLGIKKETTYGTRVVPDHFVRVRVARASRSTSGSSRRQQLGSSSTFARGSRRVATTRSRHRHRSRWSPVEGLRAWLDLLHGNTVTPVQQAATIAYLQTHNIGLTAPSSPRRSRSAGLTPSGTVRPFDYLGCVVTSAQFSWDVDDALMVVDRVRRPGREDRPDARDPVDPDRAALVRVHAGHPEHRRVAGRGRHDSGASGSRCRGRRTSTRSARPA